jgi:NMD protein affecting ribosome stability and mRNA decay
MSKLKVHGYAKNWCTFCGGNIYKEKEILCEDCLADVEAEMETRRSINYD